DTDGDNLHDGWEVAGETPDGVALPGADPRHKDLYVHVTYAEGSQALREPDRASIRGAFKHANVSNPDGEHGIDVHIDDRYRTIDIDGPFETRAAALETLYAARTTESIGDRAGVYQHVVVMPIDDEKTGFDVWTEQPGYRVLVDEGELSHRSGTVGYRDRLVIWALLRNVAGDVDADVDGGWWVREPDDVDLMFEEDVPAPVAAKLSREGFANTSETLNATDAASA
ncbi:MAG: hypothetical protein ABEJ82_03720, partial [Haloplanus sp.]